MSLMKKFLIVLVLISSLNFAQIQKRKLVWEENFDSKTLDLTSWNFDIGNGCPDLCGWGNNERQLYTETNHTLKDGNLIIQAKLENEVFTSTKITTKGKKQFQYGRFEARAKLPVGHGLWPAFWMLGSNISSVGWPKCGEIDILEYIGREPHMVFTSLHTQDSHGETINTKKTKRGIKTPLHFSNYKCKDTRIFQNTNKLSNTTPFGYKKLIIFQEKIR